MVSLKNRASALTVEQLTQMIAWIKQQAHWHRGAIMLSCKLGFLVHFVPALASLHLENITFVPRGHGRFNPSF